MMLPIASSIVVLLIIEGVLTRRNPRIHLRYMTAVFIVDVALVLYIEGPRTTVEQVVAIPDALLWFLAGVSLLVLTAYVGQFWLGRQMLAGGLARRHIHIGLGTGFCSRRSINDVTSWMFHPGGRSQCLAV